MGASVIDSLPSGLKGKPSLWLAVHFCNSGRDHCPATAVSHVFVPLQLDQTCGYSFLADVMSAALNESIKLYAELSDKNPVWAKNYADYAKFQGGQNCGFVFVEPRFTAPCDGKSYSPGCYVFLKILG